MTAKARRAATRPASTPPALPQYLQRPTSAQSPLATLRRVKSDSGEYWHLDGDPQVMIMAKRLFPGSRSEKGRGCWFPMTRRRFADLVWLQQRFPIEVESPRDWEKAYAEACHHVLERERLNRLPEPLKPPPLFRGELKRFQEEALTWLLANRRALLADEMGLGKTPTALAFLAANAKWPALVVVPPHLIPHWQRKIEEFLATTPISDGPLFAGENTVSTHVIRGQKPYALPQAQIYITHYLLLAYWRRVLTDAGIEAVVFDEVQDLRHAKTHKYSAAHQIAESADTAVGLSGTPIYGRGGEIWNVMNILERNCLGDWEGFTREWCSGYGSDVVSDPDALGAYLKREGLMLRRRKEDVASELPPKRRFVQSIDLDESLFASLIKPAVEKAKQVDGIEDPWQRGQLVQSVQAEIRQATGVAKAGAVIAFVRMLLEADERVLLFAHHHEVYDLIGRGLADFRPVFMTGRETGKQKDENRKTFMEGISNLAVIALRAAAGLDGLQERGTVVVFAELDWSPQVHAQCEDRLHRYGLQQSILCYYLVTGDGSDPDMIENLGFKKSQFVGIVQDQADTREGEALAEATARDHMKRLVERFAGRKT